MESFGVSAGFPGRGPIEPARAEPSRPRAGGAAVLDALQTGVAVIAADYTVAHANPALESLLGARIGALTGRSLWDAVPGLTARGEAELVRLTRHDGIPRACRLESGGSSGAPLDVHVARDAEGALVLEVRPVSAEPELANRNRENEALRLLTRQLAAVSDSATVLQSLAESAQSLCVADGAMVIEIRGDEGEIVAGAGVDAHLPGTRFVLLGSLTERVLAEGCTVAETEYQRDHPGFQRLSPGYEAGPALGAPLVAHASTLGVLTVSRARGARAFSAPEMELLRTIADHAALALSKSRLLEEAQAANEAKSNFLTTMSHELRTPLAALTGYGELLADEILGPLAEPQLDVVERMRSVTHHLTVMIEELLTFSSLEAGRERVRRERFEAAEVVHAAVAVIEPLARQKGLELVLDLGTSGTAVSDVDKVRQILVNLTGNAVKFTEHGRVEIAVAADAAALRFAVSDTGIGISDADLRRLFHPFAQLDTGLTRRHGGTGLGLYISRRLAALLGGEIEVRSVPQQGSTFTLVLPVEG
jgi:signal transduction histidine kinase